MGRREEKREDLKARLLEAARERIERDGLSNLRARDVTQDAGCALGGLYSAYTDLNDLIIHVNSMTLKALEQSLSLAEVKNKSPTDRLRNLGQGYLKFAMANRNLWKALFELAHGARHQAVLVEGFDAIRCFQGRIDYRE